MNANGVGRILAVGCLAVASLAIAPGCDRKEKVVDIETPRGGVEVERNKDTGEVDVEIERNRKPR